VLVELQLEVCFSCNSSDKNYKKNYMFIVATKVIEELQFEVITMLQLEH
jgi:hypothetical protein